MTSEKEKPKKRYRGDGKRQHNPRLKSKRTPRFQLTAPYVKYYMIQYCADVLSCSPQKIWDLAKAGHFEIANVGHNRRMHRVVRESWDIYIDSIGIIDPSEYRIPITEEDDTYDQFH